MRTLRPRTLAVVPPRPTPPSLPMPTEWCTRHSSTAHPMGTPNAVAEARRALAGVVAAAARRTSDLFLIRFASPIRHFSIIMWFCIYQVFSLFTLPQPHDKYSANDHEHGLGEAQDGER